jgi:hypothetical protein
MASVTVAPVGGMVGLVNILLDQNELDVDVFPRRGPVALEFDTPGIRIVSRQAYREMTPRLLVVQSGYP